MTHSFPTRRSSDRADVRLGAAILREIIVDLAAEDLVQKPALRQQFAVRRRVESLDGGAQFDQALSDVGVAVHRADRRSEAHTSELQSLMRISSAVFCLTKKILTLPSACTLS